MASACSTRPVGAGVTATATLDDPVKVVSKPTCRTPGCYELMDDGKMFCDAHWGKVTPKHRTQLFEALWAALDDAVCV